MGQLYERERITDEVSRHHAYARLGAESTDDMDDMGMHARFTYDVLSRIFSGGYGHEAAQS